MSPEAEARKRREQEFCKKVKESVRPLEQEYGYEARVVVYPKEKR
jgi:hypothetical protein